MKKGREKKAFEGITLEIAKTHLEAWLNAELEVSEIGRASCRDRV